MIQANHPKCAFSIEEFCRAHGISRAMFFKIMKEGTGPRTMLVGSRRLVSDEAAADWRRQMEEVPAA
jgi:predicted DNA-binding transcriptional regulator AlpA